MGTENFYQGGNYSLEPGSDLSYTGRVSAGKIGGTTSIQTANQLQEVSNLLNSGMKAAEVSTINAEVFEMIPKEHLKELNRITKLTGSELSMHAPMLEPSGFTQQGWSEQNREEVERQLTSTIIQAREMSPDRPLPVTIHSSAVPGTEMQPTKLVKDELLTESERKLKAVTTQLIAVNRNTGELTGLKREIRHYPDQPEGKVYDPEKELRIQNSSYWDQKLSQLLFYKERGDELLSKNYPQIALWEQKLKGGEISPEKFRNIIGSDPSLGAAWGNVENAKIYLQQTHQSLNGLFNEAYKAANQEGKEALKQASSLFEEDLEKVSRGRASPAEYSRALQGVLGAMQQITLHEDGLTPQVFIPIEQFVKEKASETFSNVAVEAYKKFGDKAPFISIENPPYGTAVSTGKDLKELIEESRKQFAKKIQIEKGLSETEAKEAAKKMIGATWDTSHISMMRKQGFGKDQLIKEAEIIAPYVKHVHYNDNLGFTHTDLPPGMGDVPLKEIVEKLEKGSKDKKFIFEGGNFFQHFKTSPHTQVLQGSNSPIYSIEAAPTWRNVYGTMGQYSSGYGPFLPQQHFSIYGGGFSSLPQELGGQVSGRDSRFSGTPMQ